MALFIKYQESKPVPEGVYVARVDGFTPVEHKQYGDSIKWLFTLQDSRPEINGNTVSAFSSTKVSPKSKLFSWLQAFGVMLDVDQQFDVEQLLGRLCRVRIKNNTQNKIVNGVEKAITYSNVEAIAAYNPPAQNTQQNVVAAPVNAPPKQNVHYQPPTTPVQSQAQTVPQNQLDTDEEFDF